MSLSEEEIIQKYKEIIQNTIAEAKQARSHPAKVTVLSRLLERLFEVKLIDLLPGIEKGLYGVRGGADLLFSNVVFEIKVDLDKEISDAKAKLKKHLQTLYRHEPGGKHIGIATDVIVFKAYLPVIENGQVVDVKEIGSIDISRADVADTVLWLDSFIFSKPQIRPTAEDLKGRFGPGSPTYAIAINELQALWNEVKGYDDARLKFDLWSKNMEIVYGSKPELRAFIDHTYLVTLVKLIVYLRLSGDKIIKEDMIGKALTGEYFALYGKLNLIEEDFFAWILHPKIANRALKLACDIAKELLRYDFSQIDEDFFKGIYQEIVERGQRHRIGEYYTPEWLTELILKEVIGLWKEKSAEPPRILDPACGSGTFLCNAIYILKEELSKRGWHSSQILDFILTGVIGVDINPLAVIIARANYLIALGDLLHLGKPIVIPVYVADSIKMPKTTKTLFGGIEVYEYDFDNISVQIPIDVAKNRKRLSQVIEGFKEAINSYRAREDKNEAYEVFERRLFSTVTDNELGILKSTLRTILTLIERGLDAIWVFMLSNIYVPAALSETKFDIVVGNPPWIAMRYIENKEYQDFVKSQILEYELLSSDQVELFTHMEVATLFFCRASDLYLKNNGVIGFVMPRSVLTGAFQHMNFRKFGKPRMKLSRILDLEDVSPLFNVPSCVLIAVKDGETSYPVPARKYAGKLPAKNLKLDEAIKHLTTSDYNYEPPAIPLRYSVYHDRVRDGATIIPRNLWFIDFDVHPKLGIDVDRPAIRTAGDVQRHAKEPWKDIELRGIVEASFIYATLLGGDIVPFGYVKLRPVVLPIERIATGYRLLDVDDLRNKGFAYMASWLEKAQGFWEKHATQRSLNNFPRIISRLDYMGTLTNQNPSSRYVVLYNASGTNLVSCVINRSSLPDFQVLKARIKPQGFIVDYTTYFYETNDENEAHYICAVLNSSVINDAIKPLQPRGAFGERHIIRRPFMLPIPQFNPNNPSHLKLAELSKECHEKVSLIRYTKRRTAGLRDEARNAIKNELKEIDKLVSELLSIGGD